MSEYPFAYPRIPKQNYYVESWYPILSDLTFKTWIYHFTPEEGNLLHRVGLNIYKNNPIGKSDQESIDQFISKVSDFFNENMKKESPPNSGYFLRLGSRSLKDGTFGSQSALKRINGLLYQRYLKEYKSLKLETKKDKISWVNQKNEMNDLLNIIECDNKALKCYTISDMFELFFNSERVLTDLFNESKYESPKFSLNFRLWDNRLTYQMEFRGFVYHHKFCALTQYDNRIYFNQVYENKEKILLAITDFYENKVRPRIESNCPSLEGTYVIDFGVIFNDDHVEEVLVIELNNFLMSTGASMFNWIRDVDILTGRKDFEFRVVEKNQYDNINYEDCCDPQITFLKNQIKAKIVNDNKSFMEKHFTWRADVVPNKV
ncbi:hypothetical protein M9Y10_019091 [Tritrichomonas musculus]|uniref:Cell division cycle protein 123 n=1 Tax=Tritrichomonas musculus TaxID=1915356 RepID=A0ABR2HIG9_9EUKA